MADPLTTFTGVSSGLDWRSLVDQILKLERRPAAKLETQIDGNKKRKDALNGLQAQVQALQDAANAILGKGASATSAFDALSTTTSGTNAAGRTVLSATAATGAAPGTYSVQVTALARGHKTTGAAGVASSWTLGGASNGTLTLSRDGAPTPFASITVEPGDGLAAIRDKINALNTGGTPSGVSAAIVTVNGTDQRLVLTSTTTGAASRFTVGDDGTSGLAASLGLDAAAVAANPTLTQAGQDAAFTVDGVPMTRATNKFDDALPGVSLTLTAEGAGTVTVERFDKAATDAVKAFVEAYNKVVTAVATAAKDPKSPLASDPIVRTMRGNLSNLVVTPARPASQGGAAGVADDVTTLAALGVSLQKDGTLAFDATKLSGLTGTRLPDVRAMLDDRLGALTTFTKGLTEAVSGAFDQRESNIETLNSRLTDRIADIDSRLDKRRLSLLAQYARFEASLGRIKAVGDQMTAQFQGLNKSND